MLQSWSLLIHCYLLALPRLSQCSRQVGNPAQTQIWDGPCLWGAYTSVRKTLIRHYLSIQPLFLSYSEPSKEIGTLLWSGVLFFFWGGEGTMMSLLKTVEVNMLENEIMTAICFLQKKTQNSGPGSCHFNTWMDLTVHWMSQSLQACACEIRMRKGLWKCFVNPRAWQM